MTTPPDGVAPSATLCQHAGVALTRGLGIGAISMAEVSSLFVSVCHRPTLKEYHDTLLILKHDSTSIASWLPRFGGFPVASLPLSAFLCIRCPASCIPLALDYACEFVGVAAAESSRGSVLVAGIAGLVAGAMSMAAGEYVSVSSQSDTESADLDRERGELATDREHEHAELAAIYVARGLDANLAGEVATQLMAKDVLGAHARDELGIWTPKKKRPRSRDLGLPPPGSTYQSPESHCQHRPKRRDGSPFSDGDIPRRIGPHV